MFETSTVYISLSILLLISGIGMIIYCALEDRSDQPVLLDLGITLGVWTIMNAIWGLMNMKNIWFQISLNLAAVGIVVVFSLRFKYSEKVNALNAMMYISAVLSLMLALPLSLSLKHSTIPPKFVHFRQSSKFRPLNLDMDDDMDMSII